MVYDGRLQTFSSQAQWFQILRFAFSKIKEHISAMKYSGPRTLLVHLEIWVCILNKNRSQCVSISNLIRCWHLIENYLAMRCDVGSCHKDSKTGTVIMAKWKYFKLMKIDKIICLNESIVLSSIDWKFRFCPACLDASQGEFHDWCLSMPLFFHG